MILDLEVDPGSDLPAGPNELSKRDLQDLGRSIIRVASVLRVDISIGHVTLSTFEGDEEAILRELDRVAAEDKDSVLVTFAGLRHDLPVIAARSMASLSFGEGLASLFLRPHIDCHLALPGDASLAGICDLLGLDVVERFLTRSEKCEADVVRTLLILLHWKAFQLGDVDVLTDGWQVLVNSKDLQSRPHLAPLFAHAS